MKKLYVATSWRNPYQPEIIRIAREMGFDVYDFREPSPGIYGFGWKQIEQAPVKEWSYERYREVLAHPIAEEAFERDLAGLQADATLLVMPAGRSAHWEHGYAVGRGQQVATLYPVDIELTEIGGHSLRSHCEICFPCGHVCPEEYRAQCCKLHSKIRDDFEPELMVKGGSGGILIGRKEMETWLQSVLDTPRGTGAWRDSP